MKKISLSLWALCLTFCLLPAISVSAGSVSAGEVKIEVKEESAVVTIDGEEFTTYNFAKAQKKPFFHPVYAPGKKLVVRKEVFNKEGQGSSKDGLDHFHHKGVWIAIDSINKEMLNYWHEGNQITSDEISTSSCKNQATLHVVNSWLDNDQKPILKNEVNYTFTSDRMMICEMKLTALKKPVTFGDTKEGLFAIRVNHTMKEAAGGRILNADGLKGEKECWGKPTAWIDYSGEVEGKTVGVSLFDDPNNFRPSRYHVRGYGLFSINPFGEKKYSNGKNEAKPVTLKSGESLSLRYGLYVHQGDHKKSDVAGQYKKFLDSRSK